MTRFSGCRTRGLLLYALPLAVIAAVVAVLSRA